MKKGIIVLICLICSCISFAQVQMDGRVLTWSIGKVRIERGQPLKVAYPLLVSISSSKYQPQLGTSTIRFFYDAGYLDNLQLERIAHNYTISGLNQSNDVFGEAFGFPGRGGVFTQFNLLVNENNPLPLSTEPVHVMDITFSVKPGTRTPSCIPLVLDNHPAGWGSGGGFDDGYLFNEGGISGSYYLDGMLEEVFLGDDEVHNYLWEQGGDLFRNKLKNKGDQVGGQLPSKAFATSGCLEAMEEMKKVSVLDFRATGQGVNSVFLDWATISEFDNDRFEVQRSTDGTTYQTIGVVKGHWNALEKTEYGFLDDQAQSGNLYYRLQQVSGSGESALSEVRMVTLSLHEETVGGFELSCFPNPTSGIMNVSYSVTDSTVPGDANFDLLIFDAAGQFVLRKKGVSSNSLLDLSEFQAGAYQVVIQNSKEKVEGAQRIILTQN